MRRFFMLIFCVILLCPAAKAAESPKYIALTFDDGPSGRYTRRLLDGLKERTAKATFFLCGYRIAENPQDTQRIFDEGHEIGIHGYSHKNMKTLCRRDIAKELADTRAYMAKKKQYVHRKVPEHCLQAVLLLKCLPKP